MTKTILVILVSKRKDAAGAVQKSLTEYGCIIKTRLGIHDGVANGCSDSGLILLELAGAKPKQKALAGALAKISGVTVKTVSLSVK